MVELVKLSQQQQNSRTCLEAVEGMLKRTNQEQKQMMSFLARAMQSPNSLATIGSVERMDKRVRGSFFQEDENY
jgi:heat shock transcription factor